MISFKSDVERLNEWMHKRNLSKKQMAHDMGLSYINVYHTMVVRGEETGRIAGNFIVRFIATYGFEAAREVFAELAIIETA